MGVEPAETWDDLLALTEDIKAAGSTPWALGAQDSWTLTDWFEITYLKMHGTEAYDTLFSPDGDWTDASVTETIDKMLEILNEENIEGGVDGSLATLFVAAIGKVFSTSPSAELYYGGGFVGGIATGDDVNPGLAGQEGTAIDWFGFPTIDGNGEGLVTYGGDVMAALVNDSDVAAFMEYLTTAEAGQVWAEGGTIISPIVDVDTSVYPTVLIQAEADQVTSAEAVRFDGSDLLPGTDLGAVLQSALRGEDMGPILEEFQTATATAWETSNRSARWGGALAPPHRRTCREHEGGIHDGGEPASGGLHGRHRLQGGRGLQLGGARLPCARGTAAARIPALPDGVHDRAQLQPRASGRVHRVDRHGQLDPPVHRGPELPATRLPALGRPLEQRPLARLLRLAGRPARADHRRHGDARALRGLDQGDRVPAAGHRRDLDGGHLGFVYAPDRNTGLMNALLGIADVGPVALLGNPSTVNWALIAVGIWGSVGFATVILSAAIKGISSEVLEAARVDGANETQIFWRIIVPMVSLPIAVVAVTLVVNVIKLFDLIFVMTQGGPGTSSRVIAFSMYQDAFRQGQYGYGAAIAVVMVVLLLPVMIFNVRRFRAEAVQQ
jgi:hypothetical protein